MKIRALIVDDEELARARLRGLLTQEADVEVLPDCADGREAVAAIEELTPDLVFLDVQMPELDGFGVLEAIGPERPPVVVFVTAYDQFALKAFEVHAVDYLLKPFDRERFQLALQRAVERVKQRDTNALESRHQGLLADVRPPAAGADRLAVKSGNRVRFIKVSDICWVEAAHNYVELHLDKESHLMRETLGAFESRLTPGKFVRISRSVIVNVDRVVELQSLFHGGYRVVLQNGTHLTLSRRYRDKLPQLGM
jgi:two-component system, LytTR family, response regulator